MAERPVETAEGMRTKQLDMVEGPQNNPKKVSKAFKNPTTPEKVVRKGKTTQSIQST